jgi:hypothetical protein
VRRHVARVLELDGVANHTARRDVARRTSASRTSTSTGTTRP